jgi:diguanylate cyclase (GGDEF)-like protein
VSRARRYGEVATLLLLDLNGFKAVNDSYGHRMGDRLLKAIGAALQARLRQTDVVARVGGDEFAVLMPYAGIEQAAIIAGDLRDVVRQCHVETDDHQVMHVTTSLGFVQIDRETANDEAVMSDADRLMYEEKRAQGYERVHLPA